MNTSSEKRPCSFLPATTTKRCRRLPPKPSLKFIHQQLLAYRHLVKLWTLSTPIQTIVDPASISNMYKNLEHLFNSISVLEQDGLFLVFHNPRIAHVLGWDLDLNISNWEHVIIGRAHRRYGKRSIIGINFDGILHRLHATTPLLWDNDEIEEGVHRHRIPPPPPTLAQILHPKWNQRIFLNLPTSVQSIDISDNHKFFLSHQKLPVLRQQFWTLFIRFLDRHSDHLHILDLSDNNFKALHLRMFLKTFKTLRTSNHLHNDSLHIHTLNLSRNHDLGSSSFTNLLHKPKHKFFHTCFPYLTDLNLSGCSLTSFNTQCIRKACLQATCNDEPGITINLSSNDFFSSTHSATDSSWNLQLSHLCNYNMIDLRNGVPYDATIFSYYLQNVYVRKLLVSCHTFLYSHLWIPYLPHCRCLTIHDPNPNNMDPLVQTVFRYTPAPVSQRKQLHELWWKYFCCINFPKLLKHGRKNLFLKAVINKLGGDAEMRTIHKMQEKLGTYNASVWNHIFSYMNGNPFFNKKQTIVVESNQYTIHSPFCIVISN